LWSDALGDGFTGFGEASDDAALDGVFLEGEALVSLASLLLGLDELASEACVLLEAWTTASASGGGDGGTIFESILNGRLSLCGASGRLATAAETLASFLISTRDVVDDVTIWLSTGITATADALASLLVGTFCWTRSGFVGWITGAADAPRGLLVGLRATIAATTVIIVIVTIAATTATTGVRRCTRDRAAETGASAARWVIIIVTVSARATVIVIVTITASIATAIIETVVSFATDRTARDVTASVSVSFESSPFACAHG